MQENFFSPSKIFSTNVVAQEAAGSHQSHSQGTPNDVNLLHWKANGNRSGAMDEV